MKTIANRQGSRNAAIPNPKYTKHRREGGLHFISGRVAL